MTKAVLVGGLCVALGAVGHSRAVADDALQSQTHAGTEGVMRAPAGCADSLSPGDYVQQVPGWPNRNYLLHIPPTYNCAEPAAVVIALHGGGSRKEDMPVLTCPDGRTDHPKCLNRLADREGFIVVYPDGTEHYFWRTFNGTNWGPGAGGWNRANGLACASGHACEANVDDIAYFNALLDTLEAVVAIDPARVFATGISNGATMTHRLGCLLSDRIAAIAPVAGGNQFSMVQSCAPGRGVPVIEFHGTADPAWAYGTDTADIELNGQGTAISVPRTVAGWAARNECAAGPFSDDLPDRDTTDRSTVTRERYEGCRDGADVVLYRIDGGGHMWPDGYQWDTAWGGRFGPTNRDINGNEVMWEFFKAHPMGGAARRGAPR